MNDLISRQATIVAIYKYFGRIGMLKKKGLSNKEKAIRLDTIGVIKSMPSAQPRWIPVTERLPEDGAEVWVTTDMLFEVTRARWHKDSNLWCHPYNSDCLLVLRPIAWMEMSIPEPYKGESDANNNSQN